MKQGVQSPTKRKAMLDLWKTVTHAATASKLLVLVLSVFESAYRYAIMELGEAYEDDLLSHTLLEEDNTLWKQLFSMD
ncbi:hypothetical protein DPMN_176022 [Dreissena polymorpha]|uniref:Uncharacterized protein n=1 Tax=Dreissena polymorpha TaxID=45954 RepID=A0A9D4E669_DREPO|nr:hypothetical protein DPMN_176022 [Dreissena polymorpha]